jgi:hypothetical protein
MQVDLTDVPLLPSTANLTMPSYCPATLAADPIYRDPTPPPKPDAQYYTDLARRYYTKCFP